MTENLAAGLKGRADLLVDEQVSAKAVGSGTLSVFATPMMVALMEQAAYQSVMAYLPEDCATVGTRMEIRHLSATPMGMQVYAESTLSEVDGRRLVFSVVAYDEAGKIGEGIHERFVVETDKFLAKAAGKRK